MWELYFSLLFPPISYLLTCSVKSLFFSQGTSQLGRHTPYGFLHILSFPCTKLDMQHMPYVRTELGITQTVLHLVCLQIVPGFCYKHFELGERARLSRKPLRPHIWNQLCTDRRTKRLKMSLRSEHPPFFGGNTAWQIFKESRYLTRSCVRYGHRRDCGVLVCAIFC